jgi:hypothetical protein
VVVACAFALPRDVSFAAGMSCQESNLFFYMIKSIEKGKKSKR